MYLGLYEVYGGMWMYVGVCQIFGSMLVYVGYVGACGGIRETYGKGTLHRNHSYVIVDTQYVLYCIMGQNTKNKCF